MKQRTNSYRMMSALALTAAMALTAGQATATERLSSKAGPNDLTAPDPVAQYPELDTQTTQQTARTAGAFLSRASAVVYRETEASLESLAGAFSAGSARRAMADALAADADSIAAYTTHFFDGAVHQYRDRNIADIDRRAAMEKLSQIARQEAQRATDLWAQQRRAEIAQVSSSAAQAFTIAYVESRPAIVDRLGAAIQRGLQDEFNMGAADDKGLDG